MMRIGISFIILYWIGMTGPTWAASLAQVVFLNPGRSDETFWVMVSNFMEAAAEDLNLEFEVLYAERNHRTMITQAQEVAARAEKPDYMVVVNEKLAAGPMIRAAAQADIKVFLMLNDLVEKQVKRYGQPREKFLQWIGTLVPNNRLAGYQIAKLVIEQAQTQSLSTFHMVAIAGDKSTPASVERIEGLQQAVSEFPDVLLHQVVLGQWQQERSKTMMHGLLRRYPQTNLVWAANDPMALGALDALREANKEIGKTMFVGGLNWSKPALDAVLKGQMVTTVGGHFMVGGWVMVLLHDHHQGKDFVVDGKRFTPQIFSAIHSKNIETYLAKFSDQQWSRIDFTRFSKVHHPELIDYDFSLDALLRQ